MDTIELESFKQEMKIGSKWIYHSFLKGEFNQELEVIGVDNRWVTFKNGHKESFHYFDDCASYNKRNNSIEYFNAGFLRSTFIKKEG